MSPILRRLIRSIRVADRRSFVLCSVRIVPRLGLTTTRTKDKDQHQDKDQPQSPIEVYEWSIWVGNPAQTSLNAARIYKNAMPNVVGTSRPKFEDKELAGKFPIAPISVVQFFGEPCRDVDVDLRAKKGAFLSHWPAQQGAGGPAPVVQIGPDRRAPPADIPQSYLPDTHWLAKLRDNKSALFLKYESHFERFIAYDAELAICRSRSSSAADLTNTPCKT